MKGEEGRKIAYVRTSGNSNPEKLSLKFTNTVAREKILPIFVAVASLLRNILRVELLLLACTHPENAKKGNDIRRFSHS